MAPILVELFIAVFVVYRLTWFVVLDAGPFNVMLNVRTWLDQFANASKERQRKYLWVRDGVFCFYCVSFWFGLAAGVYWFSSLWYGLAIAGVVIWLFSRASAGNV
jgi:hypothetical protein